MIALQSLQTKAASHTKTNVLSFLPQLTHTWLLFTLRISGSEETKAGYSSCWFVVEEAVTSSPDNFSYYSEAFSSSSLMEKLGALGTSLLDIFRPSCDGCGFDSIAICLLNLRYYNISMKESTKDIYNILK